MLVDAPSTDARLAEIPGYGWQPTPRAWEFPSHPGLVALALEALGDELLVSEELMANTNEWLSKLDQRKGAMLAAPRIERNRYCLDHDPEDAEWADLIPSREPTSTGSRFLNHAAVLDLIQRIFYGSPDDLSAAPIDATVPINLVDDRDEEDPESPHSLKNSEYDVIVAPSSQAIIEEADLCNHIQALKATGAGDGWVDCVLQFLRAAAAGNFSENAEDLPVTGSPKHDSVIKLAAEITRQAPEDARRQACSDLVGMMNWPERDHFMVGLWDSGLDYIKNETVDDVTLFKAYTGTMPFIFSARLT